MKLYTIYHFLPEPGQLDYSSIPFVVGPEGKNSPYLHDDGELPSTFASERAHYYVWKHFSDLGAPYVGFQGYRRRFGKIPELNFDVAIPQRLNFSPWSIGQQFSQSHGREAWELLVAALIESTGSVSGVYSHWLAPCGIGIWRENLFKEYMSFWWKIAEIMLKTATIPSSGYQSRLFSFLFERIFTVWLFRKLSDPGFQLIELPVTMTLGAPCRNEQTAV